jgi:hypothetical protein
MDMPHHSSEKDFEPAFAPPSPLAGFLSYLVPGVGQIYQGRVGKGLLFLICLYGLFFYGMFLGSGSVRNGDHVTSITSNVYLPDTAQKNNPWGLPRVFANLYNRPQFVGQFWIGIAAWPAIYQYLTYDERKEADPIFGTFERTPDDAVINDLQRNRDKTWDLGWVYTVIAGVLNILVIYDAFAGPLFRVGSVARRSAEGAPSV